MSRTRKNVLRRALKKSPLFAYEKVCERFPDYSRSDYESDVTKMKATKKRKVKAGKSLQRYGRWQLIKSLLSDYSNTGNVASLYKAQQLRNRITSPYEITFFGKGADSGKRMTVEMDAATDTNIVRAVAGIKYVSFSGLAEEISERLRYSGGNYNIEIT